MRTIDRTRTLPMPRRKTVVIPTRRADVGTTITKGTRSTSTTAATWSPAAGAERLEADRTGADTAVGKHAPAGSGAAPAPMSVEAPNKVPQETPAPSTYGVTLALLRGRFPAIFGAARPLKIGIHRDIQEALGQEITKAALGKFLGRWTRREAYLQALAAGVRRVDLDGNDAGPADPNQPVLAHALSDSIESTAVGDE